MGTFKPLSITYFFFVTLVVGIIGVSGSPRHGKVRVGNTHDWGLGLDKPLNAPITKHVNEDAGGTETAPHDKLFKDNDSPAIRALMNDPLFLRHLELFLEKPTQKAFHELKTRAKTLRRRKAHQVSARFFLRD